MLSFCSIFFFMSLFYNFMFHFFCVLCLCIVLFCCVYLSMLLLMIWRINFTFIGMSREIFRRLCGIHSSLILKLDWILHAVKQIIK